MHHATNERAHPADVADGDVREGAGGHCRHSGGGNTEGGDTWGCWHSLGGGTETEKLVTHFTQQEGRGPMTKTTARVSR